jgi:hypothetical protein
VAPWQRAGADGRVPGAGDGVEVRIERLVEDGALVDQAAEPACEARVLAGEVVGPHLVDDHDHEQRRRKGGDGGRLSGP